MLTSTHRWVGDAPLGPLLPTQATTGGIDFTRHFADRRVGARGERRRQPREGGPLGDPGPPEERGPLLPAAGRDATSASTRPAPRSPATAARCALAAPTPAGCASRPLPLVLAGARPERRRLPAAGRPDRNQVFLGWSETRRAAPFGATRSSSRARTSGTSVGSRRARPRGSRPTRSSRTSGPPAAELSYEDVVDTRMLRGGPALRWHDYYEAELSLRSRPVAAGPGRRPSAATRGPATTTRQPGASGPSSTSACRTACRSPGRPRTSSCSTTCSTWRPPTRPRPRAGCSAASTRTPGASPSGSTSRSRRT